MVTEKGRPAETGWPSRNRLRVDAMKVLRRQFKMFTKVQPDCNRRRACSPAMKESIDYLRLRERQERAAAKRAISLAAQRVHQELADHYSARIFGARPSAYR